MADLDGNGMATVGVGVYTQTTDASSRSAAHRNALTDYGVSALPDFAAQGRVPTPVIYNNSLVGESVNNGGLALSQVNDYPMPQSATTDRTSLSFHNAALKDGLDLGPLTGIFDGIQDNPFATFGVTPAPTFYKMRAWNTGGSFYEYWVSQGNPSSANPSGQPVLAGSLTVIAIKRPKDLVGQGPS